MLPLLLLPPPPLLLLLLPLLPLLPLVRHVRACRCVLVEAARSTQKDESGRRLRPYWRERRSGACSRDSEGVGGLRMDSGDVLFSSLFECCKAVPRL